MIDEETVVVDKLELIDALQQLGIAYHVEKEIKHALDSIFSKLDDIRMETKGNAYIIALLFRLLRGHGFGVSQATTTLAHGEIAHEMVYRRIRERRGDEALLLEFAKLDFNVVQNTYKRELKEVSRWWSNLGLWEKLSFSRDRLAENYLWPVGWAFEPKNSTFRLAQTKANCLITAIDDIYDVYGSLDELELFTEAVDRWDALDIKQLPEYMKWTDLCKAYLVEAKWYNKNYIPTLEEYLQNGWLSISGHVILSYAYCLVPDLTQHDLDLFQNYPEIMQWSSMLLRLYNDLGTSKVG
uniref:Uncharacterized protein n=1 Tax=Ananas comosus var. bracteatus TaxID=296719 RepID=A0A6V7NV84_ANACO|nr:unnamed protein product [Ananas comosus var. bracteatus]